MTLQEGVVKYQLQYAPSAALPRDVLRDLNAWRRILFLIGLVGEDPRRYGGFGYGNVSQRLEPQDAGHSYRFAISGTQTGALPDLTPDHYAIVLACCPEQNRVVAAGPIKASSESLTHGVLYELDHSVRYVLHAHSPDIWRHAGDLDISMTRDDVTYGTPEMAAEVRRLFRDPRVRRRLIFGMGGHVDGIIAFSHSIEEAGNVMLTHLARALALN